jgi:hypothetical protein
MGPQDPDVVDAPPLVESCKANEPTVLHFGTPVALVSTLNPDGSANLVPLVTAN